MGRNWLGDFFAGAAQLSKSEPVDDVPCPGDRRGVVLLVVPPRSESQAASDGTCANGHGSGLGSVRVSYVA